MSDVIPLFKHMNASGQLVPAIPKIVDEEETYEVSSFITLIAKELDGIVKDLLAGGRAGEHTVALYLLLECLHRAGQAELADIILESSDDQRRFSTVFAIGMNAGRRFPEGVSFETEDAESDISLRDLTAKRDNKEDPTSGH